jgi:hypothetical protein
MVLEMLLQLLLIPTFPHDSSRLAENKTNNSTTTTDADTATIVENIGTIDHGPRMKKSQVADDSLSRERYHCFFLIQQYF